MNGQPNPSVLKFIIDALRSPVQSMKRGVEPEEFERFNKPETDLEKMKKGIKTRKEMLES